MSELWETLTTGLVLSLLFIGVSYLFWKRYDRPTPLMIERQEEKDRLKEERKTWREVEARMRADQEEAELKAAYERRKAEERARSVVPASAEVKDAWKSLGVAAPEPATFEAKGEDANAALRPQDHTSLGEEAVSDEDLLNAAELVQVRQDEGVQPGAEEPDWELIEKLEEIAGKDEIVLPDVPEAPDLDAVALQPSEEVESSNAALDLTADSTTTAGNSAERATVSAKETDASAWNLREGEDLWGDTAREEEGPRIGSCSPVEGEGVLKTERHEGLDGATTSRDSGLHAGGDEATVGAGAPARGCGAAPRFLSGSNAGV